MALEMMLSTCDAFTDRFEFVSFPPVHEIPEAMVPELHLAVVGASILIPQQIDEAYRDGLGLGTNTLSELAGAADIVRWPSVYWAGYFPDLIYLRDAQGEPILDGPFDYHDRSILEAWASGVDVVGTCKLLENPDIPSNAQAWAAKATAELDIRGQDCDVQLAPFITSRFRDELLFYTMNHPTNLLLEFLAQEIIGLLGISGSVDPRRMPGDVLGSTFYPIHANHVRALKLGFDAKFGAGSTPFRIRDVDYEPTEAIQAFFDYYAAHSELVGRNLDPA